MDTLREKLKNLPLEPGIYVMKDAKAQVLYVGKAKNLKKRVTSYFRPHTQENPRLRALRARIQDFSVWVVSNEHEALLLERTLIRHHRPFYNVLFTDDKEYPLLRVSINETWPRFSIVRRRSEDGATYLGPYGSGLALQQLLALIYKIFPLVRCSPWEFAHARRPCNYYHMKQCLAPCTLRVDPERYREMVAQAIRLAQGKNHEVRQQLNHAMKEAATHLRFEEAGVVLAQLRALDAAKKSEQVVVDHRLGDCDIFGVAAHEELVSLSLIKIRAGALVENHPFVVPMPLGVVAEGLFEFLLQYYGEHPLPAEVILPCVPSYLDELRVLFTTKHRVIIGGRGKKKALVAMATRNAALQLAEAVRHTEQQEGLLVQVQEFLNLTQLPRVIECLDISHHQGSATVASIVCFRDGSASKKEYRHYHLSGAITTPDDFKSIHEVMRRRLEKARSGAVPLPDLMVIDGGKGQLSAALQACGQFPELCLAVVALAKSRPIGQQRSFERVFLTPHSHALVLPEGSGVFRLLTHLRNEAHRFALSFHRKTQKNAAFSSSLDEISGVGPVLRKRILAHFPRKAALMAATAKDFAEIKGISSSLAEKIFHHFQNLAGWG